MWLEDKNPPRPERIGWLVWLNIDPAEVQQANLEAYLDPKVKDHFEYIVIVVRHPDEGTWWTHDQELRDAITRLHSVGYEVILMASRWIRRMGDLRRNYREEMYDADQWYDVISLVQAIADYFGCWGSGLYAEPHADSRYAKLFKPDSRAWEYFNWPTNLSRWNAITRKIRGYVGKQDRLFWWPADCSVWESPELRLGRGSGIGIPLTGGTWGWLHPDNPLRRHLKMLDKSPWHPGRVWGSWVALEPVPGKSISPANVHRVSWRAVRTAFNWATERAPDLHCVYIDKVREVADTVRAIAEAGA